MERKARTKKTAQIKALKNKKFDWVAFLRLDQSFTSLILGIIVVIFVSILLVSFVKQKNTQNLIQQTSSISIAPTAYVNNIPLTIIPTKTITPAPVITQKQTTVNGVTHPKDSTYTVKSGDDLWDIAEAQYGSGYNWVDIVKANNLVNPEMIFAGNVLHMPDVIVIVPMGTTNTANTTKGGNAITSEPVTNSGPVITGASYTVQHGDSLWTIAQRAYNDGYQWTKIADANHLTNPSLIFSGNVLTIPRT